MCFLLGFRNPAQVWLTKENVYNLAYYQYTSGF